MPFVPVVNTAEVELRYLWDGQQVENTLYFENRDAIDLTGMLDLTNALESWWNDNLAPITSDTVTLKEIVVTDLTTATAPSLVTPALVDSVGTHSINSLPNNVSLCVSFRTAARGRSFRGRNYFVGLCEDQVTANTVAGATVTALQDAYNLLSGAGTLAANWTWSVVSRFSGMGGTPRRPTPRTTGVITPITSALVVDPIIDSMRRRLPGRGR
jgi:hypothetical protein